LCAADIFAFPSRWEGMPGAILEAMALRTPIVASDLPPVREAVTDGRTARLVPADRPGELADAIVDSLAAPEDAAARAARAAADFDARFTIGRAVAGMLAFYDHAVSAGR